MKVAEIQAVLKGEAEEVVMEQRRGPVLNLQAKALEIIHAKAHTTAWEGDASRMEKLNPMIDAMGGTAIPVDPLSSSEN